MGKTKNSLFTFKISGKVEVKIMAYVWLFL